jgi:hypothetical protein
MKKSIKDIDKKTKLYRELFLLETLDEIRKSLSKIEKQTKKK